VNPHTLLEVAPLPAAVTTLLDSFIHSHGLRDVKVWSRANGAWACVYPRDVAATTDGPGELHLPIELGDGVELQLDIPGDDQVSDEDLRFLADALRQAMSYEREARSAARELSERYEEINLLYFISEILASVMSVPDAAHWILAEVADVLGARRASLWVFDANASVLNLAAAVGEEGLTGPIPVDDPDSATAWVFREKQPLNIERGGQHNRPKVLEPRPQGREAFLSVPINYTPPEGGPRTVGVITLVGRKSNVRFSAGDARMLAAIASQVGAALETQRLVQESLRQERVVRELELAHDLQLKLLPGTAQFDGGRHQVAARCAPAESVGGDFYQLFHLSDDRIGVMIGDVSGHGFSAALIMALTMSAAAIYAQEAAPPGQVLQRIHEALIKELESTEMYLTLVYCVIDPIAQQLIFANAGHPHAFRISSDGSIKRLAATDPPLGMSRFEEYAEDVMAWRPGHDLLALFTDGLSDAFSATSTTGGERNLVDALVERRELPVQEIIEQIFQSASRAELNIPPDDRTAVLVRG
jgi:sigma-B regulation protein RsbU (phosphoserine phosphatase)